jgi:hypothetical protein
MFIKSLICGAAIISAGVLTQAQTPAPVTTVPSTPAAQATVRPTVTLTGCLYREAQIPGRTPNVAERVGVLEDYIIAGASTASGTLATGGMYKVEKIADDRLKALVGKRVEVMGSVDPEGQDLRRPTGTSGGATPDRGIGPDAISLPEIEATSIREVAGICSPTPAAAAPAVRP